MTLPSYKQLVDPLLRVLDANPDGLRVSDAADNVATLLGFTSDQRAERNPSGQLVYKNRCGWAHDRLKRAGLSESSQAATWKITAVGRAYAAANPSPLPEGELSRLCNVADDRSTQIVEDVDDLPSAPTVDTVVVPGTHRTWLIALGRNSEKFDECEREGLISIGWGEIGALSEYKTQRDIQDALRSRRTDGVDPSNDALACWQFSHDMRKGDIVYVKRGRSHVIGIGVVTSDYRFDSTKAYSHLRDVRWVKRGNWKVVEKTLSMKTLTEIGKYPGLVHDIEVAVGVDVQVESGTDLGPVREYTLDDIERELYVPRTDLEDLLALLRRKKNLILQGPPGVGKTFAASRLAYLIMGKEDESQIQRVQFHPAYSYEDFVQGLRPAESGGFIRQDGPLLRFCKDALEDQKSPYVLIIDEINRGNVSKILGELLSLLEADKREPRFGVTLAYAREGEPRFHVPPNLYVIGMMNTADRSLALVDYALRRRFVFFDLPSSLGSERFDKALESRGVPANIRKKVRDRFRALNDTIANDAALGPGFQIGHSYFCQGDSPFDDAWYRQVIDFEIAPLLREYWFDNPSQAQEAVLALKQS